MPTCNKKEILRVGGAPIWTLRDRPGFFYLAGMTIDADGAPRAYHPDDVSGLDKLSAAGHPGNWWALVTDTGKKTGHPIKQGPNDPAPGFYVSMTSLEDQTKKESDPRRYVDATVIPYMVLPDIVVSTTKAHVGDFAVVINLQNRKQCFAIFGDGSGGQDRVGEGSIALATALGVPSDARHGGVESGLLYLVFPESGNRKPRSIDEINTEAGRLFEGWGGSQQVTACFP